MGKPVTTFDKQYIVERVEARTGALTIKIKSIESHISLAEDALMNDLDTVFAKNLIRAVKAGSEAATDQTAYETATTFKEKQKIAVAMTRRITFESIPSLPNAYTYDRGQNGQKRTTGEYENVHLNYRMSAMQFDLPILKTELATLDHTLLYLKDSPVDQYTITGLRALGLIEAIKFVVPKAGA